MPQVDNPINHEVERENNKHTLAQVNKCKEHKDCCLQEPVCTRQYNLICNAPKMSPDEAMD